MTRIGQILGLNEPICGLRITTTPAADRVRLPRRRIPVKLLHRLGRFCGSDPLARLLIARFGNHCSPPSIQTDHPKILNVTQPKRRWLSDSGRAGLAPKGTGYNEAFYPAKEALDQDAKSAGTVCGCSTATLCVRDFLRPRAWRPKRRSYARPCDPRYQSTSAATPLSTPVAGRYPVSRSSRSQLAKVTGTSPFCIGR